MPRRMPGSVYYLNTAAYRKDLAVAYRFSNGNFLTAVKFLLAVAPLALLCGKAVILLKISYIIFL